MLIAKVAKPKRPKWSVGLHFTPKQLGLTILFYISLILQTKQALFSRNQSKLYLTVCAFWN